MEATIDYIEEMELEVMDFTEWLQCPYCGDEGTYQSLTNSGHTCCQQFLHELEGE